jgi:hypothetical protein
VRARVFRSLVLVTVITAAIDFALLVLIWQMT